MAEPRLPNLLFQFHQRTFSCSRFSILYYCNTHQWHLPNFLDWKPLDADLMNYYSINKSLTDGVEPEMKIGRHWLFLNSFSNLVRISSNNCWLLQQHDRVWWESHEDHTNGKIRVVKMTEFHPFSNSMPQFNTRIWFYKRLIHSQLRILSSTLLFSHLYSSLSSN